MSTLDKLAERLESKYAFNDIVLPPEQKQVLKDILFQMQHRETSNESRGLTDKSNLGLGVSALFVGKSGTGKTMAAEVLAHELNRKLYRIDLRKIESKYIGETEKNLKKIFDAAEDEGAILLFDEADALFGKRTAVKDAHDRYANTEMNYFLERMRSYGGLTIIKSKMKENIDPGFLRRLQYLLEIPSPDAPHRAAIWQRLFPKDTAKENLDIAKLSQLNLTGGDIRHIADNASLYASEEKESLQMRHIQKVVRNEYPMFEKRLS